MGVQPLLEPLVCTPLATAAVSTDVSRLPALSAEETLWSLSLIGDWHQMSRLPLPSPLPAGLAVHCHEAKQYISGVLSRRALEVWMGQLERGVDPSLASLLRETLDAHLVPVPPLYWGRWCLDFSRPRIMGVVNVTPDSFSGDGLHRRVDDAVAQGVRMAKEGADMLDVGGESTRPGAASIDCDEELARVVPVIEALSRTVDLPISVDTRKPEVMQAALDAGASVINDISALQMLTTPSSSPSLSQGGEEACVGDSANRFPPPLSMKALAQRDAPVVLMHMQGTPATMQKRPQYWHICAEVYAFLADRLRRCVQHGVARSRLIIDPGIGFGKSYEHNVQLLRHIRLFRGLGVPVLVGLSRKRLVGAMTGEREAMRRDVGSHVLAALAVLHGAHILRVHDVTGAFQALSVAHAWSHALEATS